MRSLLLSLTLFAFACGGGAAGICHWPAEADTRTDASPNGCSASPQFNLCQDNGDGTQSCHDACSSSQYSLNCYLDDAPAALGCTAIVVPTPRDVTYYCCPCR